MTCARRMSGKRAAGGMQTAGKSNLATCAQEASGRQDAEDTRLVLSVCGMSGQMSGKRAAAGTRPMVNMLAAFALAIGIFALMLGASLTPNQRAFAEESDMNLVDPTQRADNSFIYDTTIGSLFSQASLYEGRTVQVVGEVIGDKIAAADGGGLCWITLTSTDEEDKSTISCLLTEEQTNQIDSYGRYGVTGTILQVRGTYHQSCSDHDGLPDVHATNSSVLQRGVSKPDAFELAEFLPGVLAIAVGLVLMGVFYFARERMR